MRLLPLFLLLPTAAMAQLVPLTDYDLAVVQMDVNRPRAVAITTTVVRGPIEGPYNDQQVSRAVIVFDEQGVPTGLFDGSKSPISPSDLPWLAQAPLRLATGMPWTVLPPERAATAAPLRRWSAGSPYVEQASQGDAKAPAGRASEDTAALAAAFATFTKTPGANDRTVRLFTPAVPTGEAELNGPPSSSKAKVAEWTHEVPKGSFRHLTTYEDDGGLSGSPRRFIASAERSQYGLPLGAIALGSAGPDGGDLPEGSWLVMTEFLWVPRDHPGADPLQVIAEFQASEGQPEKAAAMGLLPQSGLAKIQLLEPRIQAGDPGVLAELEALAWAAGGAHQLDFLRGRTLAARGDKKAATAAMADLHQRMALLPSAVAGIAQTQMQLGDLYGARAALKTALLVADYIPASDNITRGQLWALKGGVDAQLDQKADACTSFANAAELGFAEAATHAVVLGCTAK